MSRGSFFRLGSAAAAALLAAAPSGAAHPARAVMLRRPTLAGADGSDLLVKDWGSGPPVVFAHGAGSHSDMWSYPMAHLVWQGFRCITYDRNSQADTDTPATDLGNVIETLGLRDVTLVGHALGCDSVVRYLRRQGDARVRQVALISPAADFRAELAQVRVPARIVSGMARLDEELAQYCSA